ncbi:MAG TPA: ZIP family metal transporter [Solirubrobacterales bacterium]|jgi:ZIP family zinc transporter
MIELLAAATGTTLATGLGAIPVFFVGRRASRWEPALWGLAAGVMAVASVVGLILPAADHGSAGAVAAGLAVGLLFVAAARLALSKRDVSVGELRGKDVRTSVLVFSVLFVHSLPEGFAIGTAYASDVEGLSLFVILAIALQNIPEGTSVAIPMAEAGFTRSQQFWAAVLTSAPQPVGAAVAYLLVETIRGLLAFSFAFAAGAMLTLIASDLAPRALGRRDWHGLVGIVAGAAVMLLLSAVLGV